ncbi:MAG: CoA transferase [Candidatus Moduliflexus flocculans]|nr:CoA transferase [Candidatus Moduliflexus flocculans]
MSGYGQDGPDRDLAGHDPRLLGPGRHPGGLCGRPDALPTIPPVQIADLSSALFAATGILAALPRTATGPARGRYLDIGMLDSALALMVMPVAEVVAGERGGRGRMPLSGKHPCYNVYRTRDGRDLSLAALERKFWEGFCRKVGRDDLLPLQFSERAEDFALFEALFASPHGRRMARSSWPGPISAASVVPTLEEVFADPQVAARDLVIPSQPSGPRVTRLGHPLRDRAEQGRRPCPGHGQHTGQLLGELGLTGPELDALEASGVIRRGR